MSLGHWPIETLGFIFLFKFELLLHMHVWGFHGGSVRLPSAGDMGSIPGLGRSPGEGNGILLNYSCLENPMDRGAWWAIVPGSQMSQTWLKDQAATTTCMYHAVEGSAIFGWIIFSVCCLHAHFMSLFCFECFTLNIVYHLFKCNSSLTSKLWKLFLLFNCQVMSDSMIPWTAAGQASLSLSISWMKVIPQQMIPVSSVSVGSSMI